MSGTVESTSGAKPLALLFPGQGSQAPGMGKALTESHPVARRTFEEADEALGQSLSQIIFEGTEAELKQTEVTQPAILTTSIAVLRVLREQADLPIRVAAGHSLGEWSALVAVGALDFSDAVRLVRTRGRLMQEAVPQGEGAMAAIIGLTIEQVSELCEASARATGEIVAPANMNSPEQTVISGGAAAVDEAGRRAQEAGAKKVVALSVSAPFHCAMMEPAARKLAEALASTPVAPLQAPIVSNVEAEPYQDAERVKSLLVRQVTAPVRWVESSQRILQDGVNLALEVGPGKVLTGLARRIDRTLKVLPTEDPSAVAKALEALATV